MSTAAKRHFGSWAAAVEAAGLIEKIPIKPPLQRWSQTRVIAELRAWYDSGHRLAEVSTKYQALFNAAKTHFGTWNAATKAAEVEHAIRHHLDVDLDDDPDLQASFAEALAQILSEFRDNWNKIYEELEKLRKRIISASKEPTYGLHRKKQMPLFRCFKREIFGSAETASSDQLAAVAESKPDYGMSEEDQIGKLVDLTQQVYLVVERDLKLTGFWESIPARNKLKAEIQKVLLSPAFAKLPNVVKNRAHIISRVMEIAEKNNDIILYAE